MGVPALRLFSASRREKTRSPIRLPSSRAYCSVCPVLEVKTIAFGVVYYVIFSWAIRHYDLPTIGRYDDEGLDEETDEATKADDYTEAMVANLGGLDNLEDVGYCQTQIDAAGS